MSEAERRERTTTSSARSRVRERETTLREAQSGPISTERPRLRARPHVLLLGESDAWRNALARELADRGVNVESAAEPSLAVRGSATCRLIFVDLGAANDAPRASSLTQLAAWREQLPHATWIALLEELDGNEAARLLATGVTAIPKPIATSVLAELAHALTQQAEAPPASGIESRGLARGDLTPTLDAYAELRALSQQQRLILGLYLGGSNDKAIAERCGCSEATVYEHWRRMAKKAGGSHKADAINDFHRFLAGT